MSTINEESGKAVLSAKPKVMLCDCKHESQDTIHGKNRRAHNPCKKQGPGIGFRCTVCGKVK